MHTFDRQLNELLRQIEIVIRLICRPWTVAVVA